MGVISLSWTDPGKFQLPVSTRLSFNTTRDNVSTIYGVDSNIGFHNIRGEDTATYGVRIQQNTG